jgi:SAM-dependent methyltransferase
MSRISPQEFFNGFVKELEDTPHLWGYYKFHTDRKSFAFRRNYFLRRLEFIERHAGKPGNFLWDVGCGFGTSAIFLALNGYRVYGSTLENSDDIGRRKAYWSRFGDVSGFDYAYENIFDMEIPAERYDRILVQDTLHHIEPIDRGVKIIYKSLKKNGALIAIEENGNNIVQRVMLYKRRGRHRIITVHDGKLDKDILIGNENIRPLQQWREILEGDNTRITHYEYIRLFYPFFWNVFGSSAMEAKEKSLWQKSSFLREYFYFGINLCVEKS